MPGVIDRTYHYVSLKQRTSADVVKKYDPDALQEALAEGIITGHNDMPDFQFEPDDVTAIIAYLDTLKSP